MSAMYEAYWGLREAPFEGAPNPQFLYLSPGHEEALARLVGAVAARRRASEWRAWMRQDRPVASAPAPAPARALRGLASMPDAMAVGYPVRVMAERAKG